MSNELVSKSAGSFLPAPTNFDDAWRIANVLASSDLVPKDYKGKPENCLVAMQWGADIGLPGLQALQNIAVINGRPSIWGDAAKALALNNPACDEIEEFIEGEGDAMVAVCIATRKGKRPTEQRFSVADAKKAGLWGKTGPWQGYPKRMLQMRARGFALRDAFPDSLKGLVLAEEAQDYVAEKDMGVAEVVNTRQQKKSEPQQPAELPAYPADRFAENLQAWREAIRDGKGTADQLINRLSTKAVLSEEQKQALRQPMPAANDDGVIDTEFTEAYEGAQS